MDPPALSFTATTARTSSRCPSPDDPGAVATPGVLQVKVYTDSLGAQAHQVPNGQWAPDDVDVKLNSTGYADFHFRLRSPPGRLYSR